MASIFAAEQDKAKIKSDDIDQAVYEQEPANAIRTFLVYEFGQGIDTTTDENGNIRILVEAVINDSGGGGIAPTKFDDVKIIRNADDFPIQYQFYLANVFISAIDVFYNVNTSAIEYKKSMVPL